MTLGDRLKEEREKLGMSQSVFGELAGVTKASQINYEKGVRHPDSAYLTAITSANVDVCYLLTGKRTISEEKINEELRYLADAFEAIDTALFEADKFLPPTKKRQAAEALYMAFKEGEIPDLERGANLLLSAA